MADHEPAPPAAPARVRFSDSAIGWRDRAPALAVALALQAVLLALLISLGIATRETVPMTDRVVAFTQSEEDTPEPDAPAPRSDPAQPAPTTAAPVAAPAPSPLQPTPPAPAPVPAPKPPAVVLKQSFDLRAAPPAPPAPAAARPGLVGPAFTPRPGDSKQIGTTARGDPLYAARWYREPADDELAGYLSVAQGPGWGLINCRTVQDFRVEDCEIVDEYPQGAGIARAAQAAAWQFRVRPPQKGGQVMVGAWVRIRIDYEIARPR